MNKYHHSYGMIILSLSDVPLFLDWQSLSSSDPSLSSEPLFSSEWLEWSSEEFEPLELVPAEEFVLSLVWSVVSDEWGSPEEFEPSDGDPLLCLGL
jgi:hypothetical protein